MLIDDVEAVVDVLRALRSIGVRRSFVQDLGSGGRSTTLVASIIELARSRHLEVVAEGVETEEQQAVLGLLACSHAQGYLFGRPAPATGQGPAPSGSGPLPRPRTAPAARV